MRKQYTLSILDYELKYDRKGCIWSVIRDGKVTYIQTKFVGKKKYYYFSKRYHKTLRNCIFAIILDLS